MRNSITLIFVSICLGIYLQWSSNPLLLAIKSEVKHLAYYFIEKPMPEGTTNCNIENISTTQETDIMVVGHAYGSIHSKKGTISPYLQAYIESSEFKPKTIIFTGDVLPSTSNAKWKSFKEEMNTLGKKIIISPGNHDVGDGDSSQRDIYFQNFNVDYPLIIEDEERLMVFIDSTVENGKINQDLIHNLENYTGSSTTLFIFSHHILRPNPLLIANSTSNMDLNINNIKALDAVKNNFINIILISGDSGAYGQETNCIKNQNISFISQGLGDFPHDKVLILRGVQLFTQNIRKT